MNKKKIVKIVLLVILVLILIFISCIIRKMVILKNLSEKVSQYTNSNNYYEKIVNNTGTTTEYYRKDNNTVIFITTIVDGKIRKVTKFTKEENANTYIESGEDKVALLNSEKGFGEIMIRGLDYNNFLDLFKLALATSIRSEEYNNKQCYVLSLGNLDEIYREKETGLVVKSKNGIIIDEDGNEIDALAEFYYEFNNVNDNIFIEPDINQYTVR